MSNPDKPTTPKLQPQWPPDRADVCALAIMVIEQTISDPGERRAAISAYLRDEFADVEREAVHTNSVN